MRKPYIPKSVLEETFASLLDSKGIIYHRQYKFCDGRNWKSDFFIPEMLLIVEIEGATFTKGGHTSIYGMVGNIEKYNLISLLGFRLVRLATIHFEKRGKAYLDAILSFITGEISFDKLKNIKADIKPKRKG